MEFKQDMNIKHEYDPTHHYLSMESNHKNGSILG
jgi:hypothetical protein